jgi:hypothetical protein
MQEKENALSKIPLLAAPEVWVDALTKQLMRLDHSTVSDEKKRDVKLRARKAYLEMLAGLLRGVSFGKEERTVLGDGSYRAIPLNHTMRDDGEDSPYLGVTMVGIKRLENIEELVIATIEKEIPGGYMETGVWRGGASIYTRAILRAFEASDRPVFVCDSFAGLPMGNAEQYHIGDIGWHGLEYFKVSDWEVAHYFRQYNVLDSHIYFAKGFFNATMPMLANKIEQLALLRLDGDMYQSTVDVLYHMYSKLSIGGYVIVDDWALPAKYAVLDFFAAHNISPPIIPIDRFSAYWQKIEHVDVQYWRYEQKQFKV